MEDLAGKTAFVTGAGSGIGLAIARALARAGVNVALADIESGPLQKAHDELAESNVQTAAITLDVADRQAVYAAAEQVEAEFGKLHILVNNAGVGFAGTPLDEIRDADFDWVFGINAFGVIHGIKAFVPLIKRHGEGGHVVNTSSIGGLQVKPGWHHGLYAATKYAVVAMSEALAQDLEPHGIGVSVLCPAGVATNLFQAGRNRPEKYGGPFRRGDDHPAASIATEGMDPNIVGQQVLWAIRRNELFILPHAETRAWIEERHERIMAAYDAAATFKPE